MPVNTFPIDNYKVILAREVRIHGDLHAQAAVKCYHVDPNLGRLEIYFLPTGISLPPNQANADATRGTIFAPLEHFPWYIDLLRNEAPIYARISSSQPFTNTLETGFEPAGEGEAAFERR